MNESAIWLGIDATLGMGEEEPESPQSLAENSATSLPVTNQLLLSKCQEARIRGLKQQDKRHLQRRRDARLGREARQARQQAEINRPQR